MEILKKEEDILNHISHAISNENLELEIVFGHKESTNPVDKVVFLKLLDNLKKDYDLIHESINLDIRTRQGDYPSNVRCSILDLESIKQYCITNSLDGLSNLQFIQKSNFKNEIIKQSKIVNVDYNYRINLKSEDDLDYNEDEISRYDNNQIIKDKHYRYKKRYSFETPDKLFRIDLSVVKSTKWVFNQKKYDWAKSFKDANILNNPEEYELEIEYVGSIDKKENGVIIINDFYNKLEKGIDNPLSISGSISNPLSLVLDDEFITKDEQPNYMKSPILQIAETSITIKSQIVGKNIEIKSGYLDQEDVDIDIPDDSIITVTDYDDNLEHVILKISSPKNIELHKQLNDKYPEHYLEGFKPTDYKITKRRAYGILLRKIEKSVKGDTELSVPITEIYSDYFDIDDIILKSHEQTGAGSSVKSEDRELVFGAEKLKTLTDKCTEILNNHLIYLLEIITDTKLLLSTSQKNSIIKRYKLLTNQKKPRPEFIGPQPVTLNYDHLLVKNNINIIKGYAVTEKADGIRCLLFITENTGYLITSKMEIRYTGIKFPNVEGEWLLDGEYITKNKEGGDIKLYMIFDVYYNGNLTPKPAYSYPWMTTQDKNPSRLNILNNFKVLIAEQISDGLENIRIGIKEYEYGAQVLSDPSKNKVAYDKECNLIFQKCKSILDKQGSYEYYIDGLILLPVYLGVKGDNINKSPSYIGGEWPYNFKWKPPEENTIDFKVLTEKVGTSKKDKIFTINDENGVLQKYKKLHMINGYKEQDDMSLDFCMKLLMNDPKNFEKTKKFSPLDAFCLHPKSRCPPKEEENVGDTNVFLEDNKILCEKDKSEVRDGDIVEMRYNKDGLNGMVWEPLRVRHDKQYPNKKTTADNVWKTITVPITNDLITGIQPYDSGKITQNIDMAGDTEYYVSQNRSPQTEILTSLHNYIKNSLICGVCSSFKKHIHYLDLSCGRGGDVEKYTNPDNNIKFVLGFDISNVNEACRRYFFAQNTSKGVFLQSDTSKNIKLNESNMDIKHSEAMINILYGLTKKIPATYTNIYKEYKGLAKKGFDVISSQFTLHYYLKDEDTFNGFLKNIYENINKDGYFIATFYNGNKLFNMFSWLEKNDKIEYVTDEGDIIYKIGKKYDNDNFIYDKANTDNMFGNTISVFMDSIGQEIEEYLVNLDFLIDSFKEKGLELVTPTPDKKYSGIFNKECLDNGFGSFENVIEHLPTITKKDKIFQDRYKNALKINKDKDLQLLSGLNVYLIFQKK